MATIKPVQQTVVSDLSVWKSILEVVLKKPSKDQIKKAKERAEMFKKVCAR